MSCMRVACVWFVDDVAVCPVTCCCRAYWLPCACLNGLCIVLTKGCCVIIVGSVTVVNGDGS